jgi:hypothetical protein
MDHPLDRAERWAGAYADAWRRGDGEAAAALFADGCRFRSHPFRALEDARAYTVREFDRESDREVWFGTPVMAADRAAVEYWATMAEDGRDITLAGCVMLRLDEAGLCTELRDYWDVVPGRRTPPEGWGI